MQELINTTVKFSNADTHPLVDRSLQDKQRLLKKSKLQDNLNDLLSHRPGPLDLVSKNILLLDDESVSMPGEQLDFIYVFIGCIIFFLKSYMKLHS